VVSDLGSYIEAVAALLAGDPWLGVRDRTFAVALAHRAHLGLPIDSADALRLRALYQRRGRETATLARMYRP
jgi:hypothetical protein